mmetsp:Transcript_28242/g.45711  ORF Transcript_28242/g.45711 Transcript_28242/m.45711 type:complete len:1587 (+) Transcript_28242:75-4835(+)
MEKSAKTNKAAPVSADGTKQRSLEQIYQKKSQLEHILLRPDTYIGSTEPQKQTLWVYEEEKGMVSRDVTFTPGLFKIFDEILVNAADHKIRDSNMDALKVTIDRENNLITVYNNGSGIPVEIHAEEKIYVPELIFGHLLTSSNYDDSEKKVTGGRNGYGAKLANIFSTEFIVDTGDGGRLRKFKQVFRNNMSSKSDPEIKPCKANENYTRISFKPDLKRFGMTHLDDDTVALLTKRVYDIAGTVNVKVFLNDQRIAVKGFKDYIGLYLKDKPDAPRFYEKVNERWEVCVSVSDGQFSHVSFVNNINTSKGGTHVNYVADQLITKLLEAANKKVKGVQLKPHQVKSHLFLFVNCLIENPAFDSQTKENMTLKASSFGSKCELSEDVMKKVMKSAIVENVLSFARFKQNTELKKKDGTKKSRLIGIEKLDDANDAGGRNSEHCTLILTEGDSAKALAVSGISVVGRDRYGVFPLKGKLLNVRDANPKQIAENKEIDALRKIVGLKHFTDYADTKSLRYGHIMIMTDQDHDGSHIKGLILNFIHSQWPSLLKVPGFLCEFITPIVKATKGRQTTCFYTMPEYEKWRESPQARGWTVKYYKGLGTSTSAEAKEYFSELTRHRIEFRYEGEEDGKAIELAFSKKKADERKTWLLDFKPGTFLDHAGRSSLVVNEFINKELVLFSMADNVRSIPSMVDGLKPGHRKILFCCFKRKLKNEIKVAQLAGYVSEHSAYHHGEASLMSTIIGLAQDFVGSNNINLLMPAGQFGTRLQGGKDSASARYIFTCLSPLARLLFQEPDDRLLRYHQEDGQSIEPEWYVPILPMILVNGAEGIGTGWSTSVPTYNPRDIVANLRRLMRGEAIEQMHPWFRGFKGTVIKNEKGSYTVTGTIHKIDDGTVEITELPIGMWTQSYKTDFLEKGIVGDEKTPAWIKDFKEHHTDTTVHFIVQLTPEGMASAEEVGLIKKFKLATTLSTTNMHLFDPAGKIKKYDSPETVLTDFFSLRLVSYERRKDLLVCKLQEEQARLSNKVRFICEVVRGELVISNRKKAELLSELVKRGYTPFTNSTNAGPRAVGATDDTAEGGGGGHEETESQAAGPVVGYDYLLKMPLWNLTFEKVQELMKEKGEKDQELARLMATTPVQLWDCDLEAFVCGLQNYEQEQEALQANAVNGKKGGGRSKKPAASKAKKGKKAVAESDEDDGNSEDDNFSEDDDDDFGAPAKGKKTKGAPGGGSKKAGGNKAAMDAAKESSLAAGVAKLSVKDSADASLATKATAPAKKQTGKGAAAKAVPSSAPPAKEAEAEAEVAELDEDDIAMLPLAERLAYRARLQQLPQPSAPPKPAWSAPDASSEVVPAKGSAATKKPAAKKNAAPAPSHTVNLDSDEDETAPSSQASQASQPREPSKRVRKPVAKKAPVVLDSDEDIDVSATESEVDEEEFNFNGSDEESGAKGKKGGKGKGSATSSAEKATKDKAASKSKSGVGSKRNSDEGLAKKTGGITPTPAVTVGGKRPAAAKAGAGGKKDLAPPPSPAPTALSQDAMMASPTVQPSPIPKRRRLQKAGAQPDKGKAAPAGRAKARIPDDEEEDEEEEEK